MDQTDKLILQVQGEEKVKELAAQLKGYREQLVTLNEELRRGAITQGMFEAASKPLGDSMVKLGKEIADVEKKAGLLKSQGLLQLGYVLDDLVNTSGGFERKLASISNNLPGLIMGFGGPAGLAAKIALVGTSMIALAPVAKSFWEGLFPADKADGLLDMLDKLKDKAKATQSALESLLKSRGGEEKETADLFNQYVAGKGDEMLGGIAGALSATGRGAHRTDDERREIGRLERVVTFTQDPAMRAKAAARLREVKDAAQARINRADLEQAAGILGRAPTDRGARDTIRALAAAVPGAFRGFGPGLAGELAELEPEAREKQREFEAEHDAMVERAQQAAPARRRERARAKARAKSRAELQHAQTDAALKAHADEIRQERENDEQEARDDERAGAAWKSGRSARRLREVQGQVSAAAQRMGFGRPTNDQSEDMARQVIAMTGEGVATNDAILSAIQSKAQEIQRLQQRLLQQRQQAARLQMPSDMSGQFSMMPGAF